MEIFYWNLSDKEKFIRSLWTGLVALLILYIVVSKYVDDLTMKILLLLASAVLYLIDLLIRYNKWKSNVDSN